MEIRLEYVVKLNCLSNFKLLPTSSNKIYIVSPNNLGPKYQNNKPIYLSIHEKCILDEKF